MCLDALSCNILSSRMNVLTYTARVIVLEFDSVKVGEVYVHSAAVIKKQKIVKISFSFQGTFYVIVLDEGLPYFHLFED